MRSYITDQRPYMDIQDRILARIYFYILICENIYEYSIHNRIGSYILKCFDNS